MTRKTAPLGNQGNVDTPNINISVGVGKRYKPWSLPPTSLESNRSTAGYNEEVVDGLGTADVFLALVNIGGVN